MCQTFRDCREFLILLPGLDRDAAQAVAERLRHAVADEPLPLGAGGDLIDITVSVGVASGRVLSANGLVHAADRAMYKAKAAGRNQVVVQLSAPVRKRRRMNGSAVK